MGYRVGTRVTVSLRGTYCLDALRGINILHSISPDGGNAKFYRLTGAPRMVFAGLGVGYRL